MEWSLGPAKEYLFPGLLGAPAYFLGRGFEVLQSDLAFLPETSPLFIPITLFLVGRVGPIDPCYHCIDFKHSWRSSNRNAPS